jgi:hypothetical protein
MGKHSQGLFETYMRRGERALVDAIRVPVPNGFKVEGKFFF